MMPMRKSSVLPPTPSISSSDRSAPYKSGQTVRALLHFFSELEPYEPMISDAQFSVMLEDAALACGFADVKEACKALIGPELFNLY
jgi:hypothetical protein